MQSSFHLLRKSHIIELSYRSALPANFQAYVLILTCNTRFSNSLDNCLHCQPLQVVVQFGQTVTVTNLALR